jgi:hypothetical protein
MRVWRREWLWLLIFVLAACGIQLVFMPERLIGADMRTYASVALQAQSIEFWKSPSAFDFNYWPIGYPTFIALVWGVLGGESQRTLQFIQVLMAVSLVPCAWWMAYGQGRRTRLVCAGLVSVSPSVLFLAWNGGYEILLGWLLMLALCLLWFGGLSVQAPSSHRYLAKAICLGSGVSFGCAMLVHNKAIVVLPVLIYLACKWGRSNLMAFLLMALLPLVLWATRNFIVMGTVSPLSSNGAVNLWIGNNSASTVGAYMDPPSLNSLGESYLSSVLHFWINQPEATVTLTLRKLSRLIEPVYVYPELRMPMGMQSVIHYATAILGVSLILLLMAYLFGRLWTRIPVRRSVLPLALFYATFLLVNLPFLAEPRYRTPLEPVLICVAVPTLVAMLKGARRGGRFVESRNDLLPRRMQEG